MDENHDGQVSEQEFIEVKFCLNFIIYAIYHDTFSNILLHHQACMTQKKFSTMLTLKIIDVFVSSE